MAFALTKVLFLCMLLKLIYSVNFNKHLSNRKLMASVLASLLACQMAVRLKFLIVPGSILIEVYLLTAEAVKNKHV